MDPVFLTNFDEFKIFLVSLDPNFCQLAPSMKIAKHNEDVGRAFSYQTKFESAISVDYSFTCKRFSRVTFFGSTGR